MLITAELPRLFIIKDKRQGQEIRLDDPEPTWSVDAVLNYYAHNYPILTTAKISAPKINNDAIEYEFESVMGTKG